MILEKLLIIELEATKAIADKQKEINTINAVKELLNQIDFSSEVVPLGNNEKLKNLLSALKGKQLSESEIQLIKKIQ
ncbi:MAG: hypothetical protein L3J08_08465 [Flavobacteriaceae bacterium]|nr:hypothetical protein [Flavobacteriaceae bacterium]